MRLKEVKKRFEWFIEVAHIEIKKEKGKYFVYEGGNPWVCGPFKTIDALASEMTCAECQYEREHDFEYMEEQDIATEMTDEEIQQEKRDNWRI